MAADGSYTIDARLNNADFKAGARELATAIKKLQATAQKTSSNMAKSAQGYGAAMRTSVRAAREFNSELKRLEGEAAKLRKSMEDNGGAAKPYLEITRQIQKLETELDRANQKADEIKAGKGVNSLSWQKAVQVANNLSEKIDELYAKRESLAKPTDAQLVNYANSERELSGLESKIDEMREISADAGSGFRIIARNAGMAAASLARMAGGAILSFLRRLAIGAKNAAIQLMKLAGNAIRTGLQKIGQFAGGAVKSLLGLNKASHKANGGFKLGLMTILKYGLGIRSLFFLFRRLRAAVSDGLGEIAKQNPQVKSALNSLKASLNGLKASLGSAFAPIVTAVAPALTTLINLLTTAINTIGAFFAALTGQAYFSKATAAVAGVGSAAKSSGGAVKDLQRQLAGFDDLEILSENKSGGGGGSGSGLSYQNVPIESGIKDFVSQLKALWEEADFTGIGELIAEKVNGVFEKARKLISWENVGAKITKAVDAITGIFNGLVNGIDWPLIGDTFATGVNTILNTINQLITKIDTQGLARGLFKAINKFITSVDWPLLTDTVAGYFNKIWDTVLTAAQTFDWETTGKIFGAAIQNLVNKVHWDLLGKNLATFLNGSLAFLKNALAEFSFSDVIRKFVATVNNLVSAIDWPALGETFSTLIKQALDAGITLLTDLDFSTLGSKIRSAIAAIDWPGIASRIWSLLKQALVDAGDLLTALTGGQTKPTISPEQVKALAQSGQINQQMAESLGLGANGTMGETMSNLVVSLLGAIERVVNDIDWHKIGTDIHDMLVNIDWPSILTKIWNTAQTILTALPEFLAGLLDQAVAEFIHDNPFLADLIEFVSPGFKKSIEEANLRRLGVDEAEVESWNVAEIPSPYNLEEEGYYNGGFGVFGKKVNNAIEKTAETLQEVAEGTKESDGLDPANEGGLLWKWLGKKLGISGGENQEVDANIIAFDPNIQPIGAKDSERPFIDGWGNLGADTFFWDYITGNEGQTVDVGVNYYPEGQSPKGQFANTGLGKWLKTITDPETPIDQKVALIKQGWSSIQTFVGTNKPLSALVGLLKWGWSNLKLFVGTDSPLSALIKLVKDGWTSAGGFIGILKPLFASIGLKKDGWKSTKTWLGIAGTLFAWLGLKRDGWTGVNSWIGIAKTLYAWLGLKHDGWQTVSGWIGIAKTLFAAIGLKKFDWKDPKSWIGIAKTLFASIGLISGFGNSFLKWLTGNKKGEVGITLALNNVGKTLKAALSKIGINLATGGVITAGGMVKRFAAGGAITGKGRASWWNGLPKYASGTRRAHGTLFAAGEGGPEIVGHIGGRTEVLNKSQLGQVMYNSVVNGIISALNGLQFRMPNMAMGNVLPYEIAAQIERSSRDIQNTMNANNEDLIQAMTSAIGSAVLSIVSAINAQDRRPTGGTVNAQSIIDEINRRTQMFNQSPLMGV